MGVECSTAVEFASHNLVYGARYAVGEGGCESESDLARDSRVYRICEVCAIAGPLHSRLGDLLAFQDCVRGTRPADSISEIFCMPFDHQMSSNPRAWYC